MGKNRHIIKSIEPGSIVEEMELVPGDELLTVNGEEIEDIFDYQFQIKDTYVELGIRRTDGEEWILEIDKEYDEDLGIVFENSLMDEYRSCRNHCVFCFIDQMPPGMRPTLYFKDDDSRLSFLQGNYVTLTNMSDRDIERIIRYRLEPINISFQTTNPELRCRMLHNRFAGEALNKVKKLFDAGIEMNGQIVLCKGLNDGEELERSISDLTAYLPHLKSVSVVPVGLSRYREGLYPLEPFTREDAKEVLRVIHRWQKKLYETWGLHVIHASDEWYLLAEEELPEEETYDGYLQLENGVGMLRLLREEVKQELENREGDQRELHLSLATGKLAAPTLEMLIGKIREKYPKLDVKIWPIRNDFFGESMEGKPLGDKLLLPCNMLREGENVFLDDVTVEEVEYRLKLPVQIVDEPGRDLVLAVLNEKNELTHKRRVMYEQSDRSNCGPSECGQIDPV